MTHPLTGQRMPLGLVAHLQARLLGTPVKLLHHGEGFIEHSAGRKVFQVGRLIAGHCGERRQHAAEFVSRFSTAWLRRTASAA